MITSHNVGAIVLVFTALALAGCVAVTRSGATAALGAATQAGDPAAAYCTQNGGAVETRYPYFGVGEANPLRLSGEREFCVFTAEDESRIWIATDTLYADQPSLAVLAYQAKPPLEGNTSGGVNPSSVYCSQLGGTDLFGGVNAAGGGWALDGAADPIAMCVFPDLSIIDSWGLTYHSDGTIRGADLAGLLRYQPQSAP
jgi:putative hemolysin